MLTSSKFYSRCFVCVCVCACERERATEIVTFPASLKIARMTSVVSARVCAHVCVCVRAHVAAPSLKVFFHSLTHYWRSSGVCILMLAHYNRSESTYSIEVVKNNHNGIISHSHHFQKWKSDNFSLFFHLRQSVM